MNRRTLYLLIIFTLHYSLLIPVSAQRRQIADAEALLKKGKDFAKVEKMMTDLLKDSANQSNLRIYDVWLESVERQYGELNEKMYKRQAVDTTTLFMLTHRIFTVALRLDSLDMRPDKKGRVDPQYRKGNAQRLSDYRPNLFFGGAHHLRKGNFMTAFDFFEMYIDCARQPLFSDYDLLNTDSRMGEAAYWATYCGYRMDDPVLTLRHYELARRDTTKLEYTLQYAAEAWKKIGDEARYGELLWEGFAFFPQSAYFFPRLMDDYTRKGNYDQALMVVDEALKTDSLDELFLFAKSTILLNLGRYAESLDYSKRLLAVDSQMADAYYNAGTACVNIALSMDSRKQKKQIRKMYQTAQPYMETYRQLVPEAIEKWGPALYRIYFNLNLGKQFDEIDKILKK
jgi:tetratricopeptide (TPR) repeat protein